MRNPSVRSVRGDFPETHHRVHGALVELGGKTERVWAWGDAARMTLLRSVAKPFQAMPVFDAAFERFAITSEEIALACASHNSERTQVEVVARFLERLDLEEADLVCGPHRPLIKDLGYHLVAGDEPDPVLAPVSRLASNCSGKHTGMLAVAKALGSSTSGYHLAGHPVQDACRLRLAEYAGVGEREIGEATDGCGVVCWATPLVGLARAYARLSCARDERESAIVDAMCAHPHLVAGHRRLCTALMRAYPGQIVAKVGAGGVYAAALPGDGVGLALKVEDGNTVAAGSALLAALEDLELLAGVRDRLGGYVEPVLLSTAREVVGRFEPVGRWERNGAELR